MAARHCTSTPSFDRNGWFVGGGVENNLDIFGISAPGWFMKTEYRSAYSTIAIAVCRAHRVALPRQWPDRHCITFKPWVQTVSTSLVYRFNWGGAPIVAKY